MTNFFISMPAWYDRAACVGADIDPELFFPSGNGPVPEDHEARQICSTCPVSAECLLYAKEHNLSGIWGGLTHDERDGIRRRRTGYCLNGHRMTPSNTYHRPGDDTHPECLLCRRERDKKRLVKAGPLAPPRAPTCKNGHEWTPENTYIPPTGTQRRKCRACHREAAARRRAA